MMPPAVDSTTAQNGNDGEGDENGEGEVPPREPFPEPDEQRDSTRPDEEKTEETGLLAA